MSAEPVRQEAPLQRVRDGVFFTLPEALPRGRHQLTREQVTGAQRERMLDLVVARAYQVEIDALGPPARARRRDSLTLFATYIRDRTERPAPDGRPPAALPWTAYIGAVYAEA